MSSCNLVCVPKQWLQSCNMSHSLSDIYALDTIKIFFKLCYAVCDFRILYRGCRRLSCFINPIYSSSLEEIDHIKPSKQYRAPYVKLYENGKWLSYFWYTYFLNRVNKRRCLAWDRIPYIKYQSYIWQCNNEMDEESWIPQFNFGPNYFRSFLNMGSFQTTIRLHQSWCFQENMPTPHFSTWTRNEPPSLPCSY